MLLGCVAFSLRSSYTLILWVSGSALATLSESSRPWVAVVPFCLPGETVRVRVYRNARMHSLADLIEVVTPNPSFRDDSLVECKYFGSCGGCQYQVSTRPTPRPASIF